MEPLSSVPSDDFDDNHPEWAEKARVLFAQECTFLRGVVDESGLVSFGLPEIAFAGRSNVGKSSFINALTNRKSLARTSNTPGRTKEINFFSLAEKIVLVDLPGYGYAKASHKAVDSWNRLIFDYLKGRPSLRRVFLLIDSRHGVKPNDEEVMTLLDKSAVNYQIILTKIDKIKTHELEQTIASIQKIAHKHPACHPQVIATSSRDSHGLENARLEVFKIALKAS
ncbi:MAG: YihA family ribosome biogenesis GTP-binding protein [Alphaproteobacteria bacterium]|nr:YihA family ribosome biogenesis GTP-binding protein [Alphaproteobacteria bacterium]